MNDLTTLNRPSYSGRELELRAARARAEAERAQSELLEAQLRQEEDPAE